MKAISVQKGLSVVGFNSTQYIYTLSDPRNNTVRYVGKTNNPRNRYQSHITQPSNNPQKDAWISELQQAQLQPVMTIIEEITDPRSKDGAETPWYREQCWIKHYFAQGAQLVNVPLKNPQQFPIVFKYQQQANVAHEMQQLLKENEELRNEVKKLRAIVRNVTKALNPT